VTKCWCHFASPESQCQSNPIDSTLDSLVNFHSLGRVNLPPASRRHGPQGKCDCVKLIPRGQSANEKSAFRLACGFRAMITDFLRHSNSPETCSRRPA
jgi:hypothetical protein